MLKKRGRYSTAAARWAGVGPYYAMFPSAFADAVVQKYTGPGEVVLDPFAGRGTAIFSAAVQGRQGIGVEISPLGWVYAHAKLRPALHDAVAARFIEIAKIAPRYSRAAREMPTFFHWCYRSDVLQYLIAARSHLDWRKRRIDRTAMAFLLVHLHGKREDSFSNQMRQTKSMAPGYAVNWWRDRGLKPPDIDPVPFLTKRLKWRYAKGLPETTESHVYLGDSLKMLSRVRCYLGHASKRARLLFTSPPYYGITNYYYDQWLRLWLLGGAPSAKRPGGRFRGKFENKQDYELLLSRVFTDAKELLTADATIYVRTDRRPLTRKVTRKTLLQTFPKHHIRCAVRPHRGPTQTRLFGQLDPRLGEVDFILTRRS